MWAQASGAAKAVIDLGIYSLYPNYGDLFTYAGENSNEIIMSKQFAKGGLTHAAFEWGPYSIGGSSVVEPIRNLFEKYEYKSLKDAQDPYKNIDPRWAFTCHYPVRSYDQKMEPRLCITPIPMLAIRRLTK